MLETLFSEVLSKGEWLRVWDNVISQHPGYLLLMVTAYLTTARQTLYKCSQREDFEVGVIIMRWDLSITNTLGIVINLLISTEQALVSCRIMQGLKQRCISTFTLPLYPEFNPLPGLQSSIELNLDW